GEGARRGEPAVVVEATGEDREARGSLRAPELVVDRSRDRGRAGELHSDRVVRDQQRPLQRVAARDEPAVAGGVRAVCAEGVDRRGLVEEVQVLERQVPEELFVRRRVQRRWRLEQGDV